MGESYILLLCEDQVELVLVIRELEYLLKEEIIWFCKKYEIYLTSYSHVAINNTLNDVFGGYF